MRRSSTALAALFAAVTLAASARAQPACPTAAQSGKALALSAPDGRKSEIAWLDGDRALITEQKPASRTFPREALTFRGLVALEQTRPSGKAKLEFASPLASLFPLAIGKEHQLAYTVRAEGQQAIKARMTIAAVEALKQEIGKCTYDALLVGAVIEFEGGKQSPVRYDVYIPALQAVVKSTTFDAATNTILEAESFEYEAIAAK